MKIMTQKVVDAVEDMRCDVCGVSTSGGGERPPQFGELRAEWGYGSRHDGERYEVHLCEGCFFSALATLKEERRACRMFDENEQDGETAEFGLVVSG
ncbi:hypothetical protein CLV44_11474 [Marinobacterium halophilum]|uniref:Uncharacterized protein n=1 Tax=Marinobacterium halophilum TaxID=267374 RepID=A0A2P8EUC1_9GAMM|nr:hypothetical protein [Marinobacterium halophilum]PSL13077.1 hypothetical protein CLV44_11474 [Marinobacterium halophilum]